MEKKPIDALLADARETYGVFGKAERAIAIVDRALALDPEHVEALNLKAAILYELDRDTEAAEYHQRALALNPYSIEALHGLAAIANDDENYTGALQWLERAFRAIPYETYAEFTENEDYRQRVIAELYNEQAFALWYLGRKDEAEQVLTETAPEECPLEVESFEDQLDWLEHHPLHPDD